MTARTHDLGAITALGLVLVVVPIQSVTLGTALLAILANQIGGIAPDIDQPTAPFWRNLPSGNFVGKIFAKMLGGHRFLSHSLLGILLFGVLTDLLLYFLHPLMLSINITLVWYAFLIGMISHLLMDTFTKEGVPWLLPVPIKFGLPPVHRLRITTGKYVETLIIFPALLILDIWLFASHYNQLMTFIQQHLSR
ncbi:MAG: metal-dependent hydrolase [Candidatus Saccharimonadales bacterium]